MLICALIVIGFLVFYLNKENDAVPSINRIPGSTSTRTPVSVAEESQNDTDEPFEEENEHSNIEHEEENLNEELAVSVDDVIVHDTAALTTNITETVEEPIVDQEDSDTETYLENEMAAFHAIKNNKITILRQLVSRNVDIYTGKNGMGYSAFHYAAHRLNIEAMKVLLQYQNVFNPNSTLEDGSTALHIIAKREEKYHGKTAEVAIFLIRRGADLNAIDSDGATPAFFAIDQSNLELLTVFIDYLMNARHIIPEINYNMLHFAMMKCNRPIIKALIDYAPDLVNDINMYNRAPIHEAAAKNCVDGLKELILTRRISKETKSPLIAEDKCNVEPYSDCLFGATPLHFAVKNDKFEATEFLLLIESKLQIKDERNNPPYNYVPVNSSLRLYLIDREDWEKRHPPDGQAEKKMRHIETRSLAFQMERYQAYRGEYLHRK